MVQNARRGPARENLWRIPARSIKKWNAISVVIFDCDSRQSQWRWNNSQPVQSRINQSREIVFAGLKCRDREMEAGSAGAFKEHSAS